MATNVYYSNDEQRQLIDTEVIATATTLTKADSNKVFILDAAAGVTVTLPALADGLRFKFIVGAAFATTNFVIASAEGDNINGIIADLGATPAGIPASGEDQINFVASAETIGDYIEIYSDGTNYYVNGFGAGTGSITFTAV